MKQNTLNDSLEIHHLYYLQVMSKNGVLCIKLRKSGGQPVLAEYTYQTKITVGNSLELE